MADNFVRLIDHRTEFAAFLQTHQSQLSQLNGHLHFIVGHARSSTSISAFIADEIEDSFVFYEDYPVCHAGIEDFAGWYRQFMNDGLKARDKVRSHIEDYDFAPGADGIDVYAELVKQGKTIFTKASFGPHGQFFWDIVNSNAALYHSHFPDSRYLLTYRSPESAVTAMDFFFNEFLKVPKSPDEIAEAYLYTLRILLHMAQTFRHVFFLNDSVMSEDEAKQAYREFLPQLNGAEDKYKIGMKRGYEDRQLHRFDKLPSYCEALEVYRNLEDIRRSRQASQS